MGFGLIAAGFVILFNPVFNIIDLLPDFIGVLLIYAGLTKTATLNEDVASARKKMLYLALVDIAKLICIGFLNEQDGTRYLMFATIFGVLECICFIPAVCDLFIGVEHLGMTYDSASVNRTYRGKGKSGAVREYSDTAKKVAIAFYIFRNFMALAPELTELQAYEHSGFVDPRVVNYSMLKMSLHTLSAFFVLIFSVIYLQKTVGFWISVKRDRPFCDALQSKYGSFIEANKYYLSAVKMGGIFTAMTVASLSVYTMAPNNMWVFPTALCALIIGIASISAAGDVKKALPVIIPAVLSIALSVVTIIQSAHFYDGFALNDIFHKNLYADAIAAYFSMSVVYLFEKLCLTASFVMFALLLRKISLDFVPKSVMIRSASNRDNEALRAEITRGIKKRFLLCIVFLAITLVYSAVLPYIYYGTGTVFEANRNVLMNAAGELELGVLLTSSYAMYSGIFSILVIISFALVFSLRRYMKSEIVDPICDWGREI